MSDIQTSGEATARINELLGERLRLEQENRALRKTVSILEEQKRRMAEDITRLSGDLRSWEGSSRRFENRIFHGRHTVQPRYDD